MRYRMTKTIRGTRDGVSSETFEAGQEVEFGPAPREQELLQVFLREGWAEEVRARPAPENTTRPPAPENAARPPAPENAAAGSGEHPPTLGEQAEEHLDEAEAERRAARRKRRF